MKAIVARVAQTVPLAVAEIDISTDPALEALYGLEIPVLMVAGKKAAKYRITEEELAGCWSAARDECLTRGHPTAATCRPCRPQAQGTASSEPVPPSRPPALLPYFAVMRK